MTRTARTLILKCSAWAPLRGPVQRWPLALCDNVSVSQSADLEITDLVYSGTLQREFCSVYENAQQRWYFLSGQMPHEHLIFRQAMLEGDRFHSGECIRETQSHFARLMLDFCEGVPHGSVPVNNAATLKRESIEVKLLALYK